MDYVPLPRLSAHSGGFSDAVQWSGLPSARCLVQSPVSVPCRPEGEVLSRPARASCHRPRRRGARPGLSHCGEYPCARRRRRASPARGRPAFFSPPRSGAPPRGTLWAFGEKQSGHTLVTTAHGAIRTRHARTLRWLCAPALLHQRAQENVTCQGLPAALQNTIFIVTWAGEELKCLSQAKAALSLTSSLPALVFSFQGWSSWRIALHSHMAEIKTAVFLPSGSSKQNCK